MSAPVSHWFGPYGPRCGTRDGVNALDMDDETVTCKRCIKAPRSPFDAITPQWKDGRWVLADAPAPEAPGPYEIEIDLRLGVPHYADCKVVDLRRPNPGDGNGFAYVFTGTFAECDAWIEAHHE